MKAIALLAALLVACATPAIFVSAPVGPCGQYPVDCGESHGVSYCCPEGNLCRISPDGNRYCEFNPEARRVHPRLDGGSD